MKTFLVNLGILLISSSSFAGAVALKKPNGVTFYDISSAALTIVGVEVRVQSRVVCRISTEFLKANNMSGLDLMKDLTDQKFDNVVECNEDSTPGAVSLADKIRPRMAP